MFGEDEKMKLHERIKPILSKEDYRDALALIDKEAKAKIQEAGKVAREDMAQWRESTKPTPERMSQNLR